MSSTASRQKERKTPKHPGEQDLFRKSPRRGIRVLVQVPASLSDRQVARCIDFVNKTKRRRLGSIELKIRVYMILEYDIIQRQPNANDLNADNYEIEAELLKYENQLYYDYVGRSDAGNGVKLAYRYTISVPWSSPKDRTTMTTIENWFLTSTLMAKYELRKIH